MLDDPQSQTTLKIGNHKLIWGWFRMGKGFTHMEFGTLLYKGGRSWELGTYFGVFAAYLRWELPS